jgi:hypothetical protein
VIPERAQQLNQAGAARIPAPAMAVPPPPPVPTGRRRAADDCCPGEEAYGDPRGLHSDDCPVYLAFVERFQQAMAKPQRITVLPPQPTLDDLTVRYSREDLDEAHERGVAEGRRQATEGWKREEQWAISYTLNGDPCEPAHGGSIFDSRKEAERSLDVWRRHYPELTYADEAYHRRETLTGQWTAEQDVPAEGGDHGDR